MTPAQYYPNLYKKDFDFYIASSLLKPLELCPLTLSNNLKNNEVISKMAIKEFFAVLYSLNLVAYVFDSYLSLPVQSWNRIVEKYLSLLNMCPSHGFGGRSMPIDVINFIKYRNRILVPKPMLNEYFEYFILDLLPTKMPTVPVRNILRRMAVDDNCSEIKELLMELAEKQEKKPEYDLEILRIGIS